MGRIVRWLLFPLLAWTLRADPEASLLGAYRSETLRAAESADGPDWRLAFDARAVGADRERIRCQLDLRLETNRVELLRLTEEVDLPRTAKPTLSESPAEAHPLARFARDLRRRTLVELAEIARDPEWQSRDLVGTTLTIRSRRLSLRTVWKDPRRISWWAHDFVYRGGAHGTTQVAAETLDRTTGNPLRLDELLPPPRRPQALRRVRRQLLESLRDGYTLLEEPTLDVPFYCTATALHFVYPPCTVAPHAAGILETAIPLPTASDSHP
ncbi:MAG: RsiV family protein [Kiritimatiellia bacterium]